MVALVLVLLFLSGCSSTPQDQDAKSLLETLEFGPEECGQFQLTGDVEVGSNPLPWFATKMHMNLDKQKPCNEEIAP